MSLRRFYAITYFNKIQNHIYPKCMGVTNTRCLLKYSTNNKQEPKGTLTMESVKADLAKVIGVKRGYKPSATSRTHLSDHLATSQNELPTRTMKDSFMSALIPLSNDLELQDKYISFMGHVRIGRLLEDMDIFAAAVVQKHILNPKLPEGQPSPYTLVTALVDKIDFTDVVPRANEDIRLSGHVSWVGTSSTEVVVWLEQKFHGTWKKLTRALFVMVARDAPGLKSAPINPLITTTEEEKKIVIGGETRKKNRMRDQSKLLTKVVPNTEEQKIIHDLFLRTVDVNDVSFKRKGLPEGSLWMEDCTLSNLIFSHPEDRNMHNKVFGGFLMRQAMELSWVLAFLYSKHRPTLKSISNIIFHRPTAVSSLIRMNAFVVYSQKQYFQITVFAETWEPTTGKKATTNSFHFTYEAAKQLVPEIFPSTYQEAMMYVDGQRHFNDVMIVGEENSFEGAMLFNTNK